ncbi:hypothetical protein [Guptibacillus spartinae]|uniref:hypothetical protein n=1 Tax=Guptibacillus spartinae TaxID=3025679 RepID=UPI00235F28F6|nr:hypothetical protein [Pseudalkalibacillus spartinae]
MDHKLHSSVKEKIAEGEKWTNETYRELEKIHVPITAYNLKDPFIVPIDNQEVLGVGMEVAKQYYQTKYPTISFDEKNPNHMKNALRIGQAFGVGFEAWEKLNAKINCNFLANYYEGLIVEKFKKTDNKEAISEIIYYTIPDINYYTWEEIIALRKHPFFNSFRKKISQLNEAIDIGDIKLSKEIIEQLEQKEVIEMIKLFKPSPKTKIIKGVTSNVPLPIPINPASVYFATQDIKTEYKLKNKYGWLFFLLDVRNY